MKPKNKSRTPGANHTLSPAIRLARAGLIALDNGDPGLAERKLTEALSRDNAEPVVLFAVGRFLRMTGRFSEALTFLNNARPHLITEAMHFELGATYAGLNRYEEARLQFVAAHSLNPDNPETLSMLAEAAYFMGDTGGVEHWSRKALEKQPNDYDLTRNFGFFLQQLRKRSEASKYLAKAYALSSSTDAESLLFWRMNADYAASWSNRTRHLDELKLLASQPNRRYVLEPFPFLAMYNDPPLLKKLAEAKAATVKKTPIGRATAIQKKPRIKLAYASSDFCRHATSFLLAEFFHCHAKDTFELIAYSWSPDDDDPITNRVRSAFESFNDVNGLTDAEIAKKIANDGIDILIDLKGYTLNSRPGIFLSRPAPIQINYLGYPGTLGADAWDYIIGDAIVTPVDDEAFFSERILRMPYTYYPADSFKKTPALSERQHAGLPDNAIVLACFNQLYKLSPEVFQVWLSVLKQCDNTVLWLFTDDTGAKENLSQLATENDIAPSRLIFAENAAQEAHLARVGLADIFLDTFPYNAHTNAVDALWMGVPFIALSGKTFPSRVGESLLTALNCEALVTRSLEEYEQKILHLVQDSAALAAAKENVRTQRDCAALFDTRRYTRDFEKLLIDAYENRQSTSEQPE